MMEGNTKYKNRPVRVTADSAADLPAEWVSFYNIGIIRHMLHTERGVFEDGTEIDSEGLSWFMENRMEAVRSVVPDEAACTAFFAEQLKNGEEIFHVSISHQASPVYESASRAAKQFPDVHVFNSGNMAGGAGICVLYAAHLAAEGKSIGEIQDAMMRFKKEICSTYVVRDPVFLVRGGRMKPWLGRVLNAFLLHPVITMKNDRINYRFAWSSVYAENYIRRQLRDVSSIDTSLLFVSHTGFSETEKTHIRQEIARYAAFDRVVFLLTSSAITVNTGPGTFGLIFYKKRSEQEANRFAFLGETEADV